MQKLVGGLFIFVVLFLAQVRAAETDVYQHLDLVLDTATLGQQVDMLDNVKWPLRHRRHVADAIVRQIGWDLKMSGVLKLDPESGRFVSNSRDLSISYFESMGNEPILILSLWVIAEDNKESSGALRTDAKSPELVDALPALENESSLKLFRSIFKSLSSHFKPGYSPIMAGGLKAGRQSREAHFRLVNSLTGLRLQVTSTPSLAVSHLIKYYQGPMRCDLVLLIK